MALVCEPCHKPTKTEGWCKGFCYGDHHDPHSVSLPTEYVNPAKKTEGWCNGYCYNEHHDPHSVLLLW